MSTFDKLAKRAVVMSGPAEDNALIQAQTDLTNAATGWVESMADAANRAPYDKGYGQASPPPGVPPELYQPIIDSAEKVSRQTPEELAAKASEAVQQAKASSPFAPASIRATVETHPVVTVAVVVGALALVVRAFR